LSFSQALANLEKEELEATSAVATDMGSAADKRRGENRKDNSY